MERNFSLPKEKMVFLLLFVFCLVVTIFASFALPEKFYGDSKIIAFDRFHEAGLFGSYPLNITFYKITGLKHLPFFVIAILQLSICFYLIKKIGIPKDFHVVNTKNLVTYIFFLLLAVFISMPTKEFLNFIFIYYLLFLIVNPKKKLKKKFVLSVIALVLFGIFYRTYYVMMPIIAAGMYLISKLEVQNKTIATIFYGILIMASLSITYGFLKGEYISSKQREELNQTRTKNNNSAIESPVDTKTWYGETIGLFYGFVAVNFPLTELRHIFSPQIIAFVVWQLFLFYILFVRFSKLIYSNKFTKEMWLFLIMFSFFIVQAVFEPDLGSAIRHKIGILPIIFYCLHYEKLKSNTPKSI